MADRYELSSVREVNGKRYWTRLGTMFPHRNGDGFNIILDAVPASQDGQFKIVAMVPKERDQQRGNGGGRDPQYDRDLQDGVPF